MCSNCAVTEQAADSRHQSLGCELIEGHISIHILSPGNDVYDLSISVFWMNTCTYKCIVRHDHGSRQSGDQCSATVYKPAKGAKDA